MQKTRSILRKLLFAGLTVAAFATLAAAQDQDAPKRGPSTPEERKRFIAIAHKLEAAPLDPSLRKERDWALHWIIDIPDINVNPCADLLGDFMDSRYRYKAEINGQVAFSMAAFMIEHPDKAKDIVAANTAGLEGALKAYRSILRIEPTAQSPFLEALAERQSQGKLTEVVRELTKKGCENGDQRG
jgi:hypothetical protein